MDFAILTLFNRYRGSFYRPPHLLCHGFQRATNQCRPNHEHDAMTGIRGIVPQYPNRNVSALKNSPWTEVLGLLGRSCEEIMLHLLLDCSVFIQVDEKRGSFYQLSGETYIFRSLVTLTGNNCRTIHFIQEYSCPNSRLWTQVLMPNMLKVQQRRSQKIQQQKPPDQLRTFCTLQQRLPSLEAVCFMREPH